LRGNPQGVRNCDPDSSRPHVQTKDSPGRADGLSFLQTHVVIISAAVLNALGNTVPDIAFKPQDP